MSWISPTAYAGVRGVTKQAVLKAIKTGRLKNSVRKDAKDKWEVNPEAATLEWNANTDKNKQRHLPPSAQPSTPNMFMQKDMNDDAVAMQAARLMKEDYTARLAKLKFDLDSGRYLDAEEVKSTWFSIVTSAKTKLLALPSKAKANLPHLTPQDVVVIDRLVREALEDLSHELD